MPDFEVHVLVKKQFTALDVETPEQALSRAERLPLRHWREEVVGDYVVNEIHPGSELK